MYYMLRQKSLYPPDNLIFSKTFRKIVTPVNESYGDYMFKKNVDISPEKFVKFMIKNIDLMKQEGEASREILVNIARYNNWKYPQNIDDYL